MESTSDYTHCLVPEELSASEALFGFCGWLTSRKPRTIMSSTDDVAPIARLVQEFCNINGLAEPRDGWEERLIHPGREEKYEFKLILGEPDLSEDLADRLYVAGCDDGLLGMTGGVVSMDFCRKAGSLAGAVNSAVKNIASAGVDVIGIDNLGTIKNEK